jgi:D-alanine transaminase
MSRIAYVNGSFVPYNEAYVSMNDRGYHFADGVYEVFSYNCKGVFVDAIPHFDRLRHSLEALDIAFPLSNKSLLIVMHELMRRNRCREGYLYLQITRGVAPRDHVVLDPLHPVLTLFVRPHVFKETPPLLKVFTTPDIRWKRNDIKSISLLGAIMGKYQSARQGGDEAWLYNDQGFITEGSATNAWIVNNQGIIQTHPVTPAILNGIVRQRLLKIAETLSLPVEEKAFTIEEALKAQEAFLTSSTKGVHPIISIDDHPIGKGMMGPITDKLQRAYWHFQHTLTKDYDE